MSGANASQGQSTESTTTQDGEDAEKTAAAAGGQEAADKSAAGEGGQQSQAQEGAGGTSEGGEQEAAGASDKGSEVDLEVKLPEGVALDPELMGKFTPLAKELGLKSEGAQKLVDLFIEAQKGQVAAAEREISQRLEGWRKAAKADKEFGGAAYDANSKVAKEAMVRFSSPELRTLLNETGLGDHPEIIRAFWKVGQAMAEDTVAGTAEEATKTPANSQDARLRKMYPTMFNDAARAS